MKNIQLILGTELSQGSETIIFEFYDPELVLRPSFSQILKSREYP